MSTPTPPNVYPQGTVPVAKKTSIWVWILGGIVLFFFMITLACGVIAYMGMNMIKKAGFDSELMRKNPGLAMAKMVTAMNPDYETVSTNDRTGVIVVREKSTGKKVTLKFDPDAKKMVVIGTDGKESSVSVDTSGATGGVTMQTADGTVKFGSAAGTSAPSWVPVYPGSSPQNAMSATNGDGAQNTFTFKMKDPASKILTFYTDALKAAGFTIAMTTTTDQGGMVQATDDVKKRTINVIVGTSGDETETAVTSIEKK